ncbi:4-diphosphocytidyl-2C-methyl-D-erythritol synthase [Cenarchaeum symbiosum A]|uniref:4-diphosphocytidyl-2C-methyl-D-erythritol synthase n=1 Tax=Cenarchaeum symbiosum (strain A) TaxID=414004 RepID=A0RZ35_CENSY|nr:4-diphosphocytidyl-2C-methyl-D-erythritol synthase [Cenarchaeum symbiosum A]
MGMIMAGGRGTRMGHTEKLLLGGTPMVLRVLDALKQSGCFGGIAAAISPNAPDTALLLEERGVRVIETGGSGYPQDLNRALSDLEGTVMAVPGDLPLLDAQVIRVLVDRCRQGDSWTSFVVSEGFLCTMGLRGGYYTEYNGKRCAYTGVSVVDAGKAGPLQEIGERLEMVNDPRIAFNVNTVQEYRIYESMRSGTRTF